MKKLRFLFIVMVVMIAVTSLTACTKKEVVDAWKWTPGKDAVTYKSSAADDWSPTYTVNVKIVGGEAKVLFDGPVTLTSPQMMASEFLAAAINDKGIAQEGLDIGFITKVGDYENDSTNGIYWMFYVNGELPSWASNDFRMRNGDYLLLAYEAFEY